MTRKRFIKWTVFVVILSFILCIITAIQRRTVMDQIYYAGQHEKLRDFNTVPEIRSVSSDELLAIDLFGGLSIEYKKEYLPEDMYAALYFSPETPSLFEIHGAVDLSDTEIINFAIDYNSEEKTVTYNPIIIVTPFMPEGNTLIYTNSADIDRILAKYDLTTDNIMDYQNFILYDIVIKSWADAHNEDYEKEREKVKRLPIINNTFSFPE